jgi:DNA-binding MarR family transcriptional regulator
MMAFSGAGLVYGIAAGGTNAPDCLTGGRAIITFSNITISNNSKSNRKRMNEITVIELLGDFYRRMIKALSPLAQSEGLSMTEMLVVWKVHHGESRRVKELVADVGLPPSTLTGVLDRLTAGGWPAREADPEDRRAVVMRRTEKLDALLLKLKRERTRLLEAAFKKLPRDLVERLGQDLSAVLQCLRTEEDDS